MLLRICLIIAILGGGAVVAVNFVMVQKALVQVISDRDTETAAKKDALEKLDKSQKELASTKSKLDATTRALAQTKTELDSANGKITELNAQNTALNDKLKGAVAKSDKFEADLEKFSKLGVSPEQIIQLQADVKKSAVALAGVNAENKLLLTKVDEKEQELQRLRGTSTNVVEPSGLKGKVVAVDPKFDFVILNIGYEQNVLANGVMMIARDGKLIGKVRIASVTSNKCVANILPDWRRGDVLEGDEVLD
jgi:hypothetical protein